MDFKPRIRPILAEKIVYYQDKNFKKRLLPPPIVKRIKPTSQAYANDGHDDTAPCLAESTYRPMTLSDTDNIDNIPLTAFQIDLDGIFPSTGQPLAAEEIKAAAKRYLNYYIED